jgi:hypothetical protein
MTSDLTMPTIISVKQFDTTITAGIDRSDTDVREMLELFEKVLLAHGYQQESINDTICEIADKVREDVKKNKKKWEANFEIDDNDENLSDYRKHIIKKYL